MEGIISFSAVPSGLCGDWVDYPGLRPVLFSDVPPGLPDCLGFTRQTVLGLRMHCGWGNWQSCRLEAGPSTAFGAEVRQTPLMMTNFELENNRSRGAFWI